MRFLTGPWFNDVFLHSVSFALGMCVPSGCTDEDAVAVAQSLTDVINTNISSQLVTSCQEENPPYSTGAIAAM